jgi:nitrous oxidase accessory protein NosD
MWTQSISIQDKILTIWGAGRDQTILMSTAGTLPDGITIAGQSIVTVRGLAVYSFRNGVVVNGRSSLALRDVQISGNALYGLQALGLAEATLENSHVSYNLGGVAAWDSAHVTVQYAQIFSNHEDGIWLDFASSGWLLNNIIQGNQRYGVRVYSLENLSVCWRNIVVNNVAGNFYPEMVAQQCH